MVHFYFLKIVLDSFIVIIGFVIVIVMFSAYKRILEGELRAFMKYLFIGVCFFYLSKVIDFSQIFSIAQIESTELVENVVSFVAMLFFLIAAVRLAKFSKAYGLASVKEEILDFFKTDADLKSENGREKPEQRKEANTKADVTAEAKK